MIDIAVTLKYADKCATSEDFQREVENLRMSLTRAAKEHYPSIACIEVFPVESSRGKFANVYVHIESDSPVDADDTFDALMNYVGVTSAEEDLDNLPAADGLFVSRERELSMA